MANKTTENKIAELKIELNLFDNPLSENNGIDTSILLPIRCNCQQGKFTNSNQDPLGSKMSITVLQQRKYFGDLGQTKGEEWLQLFFLAQCDFLAPNVIYYTYIKTRSLTTLQEKLVNIKYLQRKNPAIGIFELSFKPHQGKMGQYYSVEFDWRERNSEEEFAQLQAIAELLKTNPVLEDFVGTEEMVTVENLSSEEATRMRGEARAEKLTKN